MEMPKFATFFCAAALAFVVGCAQTDMGVTTSVQTRLASDDMVQARDIDVSTENGIVTLSGDVRSQAEREQALMIARQTDGVRDVVDELRVTPTVPTTGFDDRRDLDRRDDATIEPDWDRDLDTAPAP
jgi:hypothetical protein